MNHIKIRREGDKVIVERTYQVVPNRTVEFNQRPKVDFSVIKSYVIQALKARMDFCLQQLDAEILPAEDKIFNEMGAIFSPSKGLYFNQQSFESMESALKKIESNPLSDIFHDLDFAEMDQIVKSLVAFSELPNNEAHYLSGLTMEALMVSEQNTCQTSHREEDIFGA